MNLRARFVLGLAGGDRMVHDIPRLVEDVGRLGRVRFGRLLDHEPIVCKIDASALNTQYS
jgi:hypothetical protein